MSVGSGRLVHVLPRLAGGPCAGAPASRGRLPARCALYDLRHPALSTWLNSGVDPTEVAERAGNSVEMVLSRYAKCIDGRQEIAIRKIEELLRTSTSDHVRHLAQVPGSVCGLSHWCS
ncbi:hypothetical protein GCM10010206_70590 [Streptomyces cinerochromogenes]|nr:hypothetical protein GCM10010206_70590 [Streptomyces cinerochromogenes]